MDNLILGKLSLPENTKVVGFFGQSGAGKTSIIKALPIKIGKYSVLQNTGIIRHLFQVNSKSYTNPVRLLDENAETLKGSAKVGHQIIGTYIKSQLQLLNDFSTEVFQAILEKRMSPSVIMFDRSPVDFYTLTACGVKFLKDKLGISHLDDFCTKMLELTRVTAEKNTEYLFNTVFSTQPWQNGNINSLEDGIRDQYLTEYYTGTNWYSTLADIKLNTTKVVHLNSELLTIDQRVKAVVKNIDG